MSLQKIYDYFMYGGLSYDEWTFQNLNEYKNKIQKEKNEIEQIKTNFNRLIEIEENQNKKTYGKYYSEFEEIQKPKSQLNEHISRLENEIEELRNELNELKNKL